MFVVAIILWAVAVGAFAGTLIPETNKAVLAGTAAVTALLGVIAFGWSGVHSVPSKSIGVPVSLGKVESGYADPGAHWTWDPFLRYAIINESIQTTAFEPGGTLPGTKQCDGELPARIGGQQLACAKITIQWRVRPSAASSLYSDYANQGDLMTAIENALVVRELELVVNQQVGDYDPITDYQTVVNTNSSNSQFTAFGPQILATMQRDIGSQIEVLNVLYPYNTYSQTLENKLQQIQQAHANYAVAQENVKVNQENALAFAKLGNPTVNQLIAQCLTDSRENRTSPMGCFPGSSSGLIIGK